MRTNLILHFHCSECGKRLEVCYPKETRKKPVESEYGEVDDEPTGADCFYPPAVSIRPCRYCIEKYTEPARKLQAALSTIIKA